MKVFSFFVIVSEMIICQADVTLIILDFACFVDRSAKEEEANLAVGLLRLLITITYYFI